MHTLSVNTGKKLNLLNITDQVQQYVRDSGVDAGVCHIFVAHTTAGLTINENADPSVQDDILMILNKIVPDQASYRHAEGNSPAHVKSSLMGPNLTVIVDGGRLVLGTWQGIYLCEFDGPRTRKVHLKVMAG
jgi:secondary thiamine-phosphate synthase enzyme